MDRFSIIVPKIGDESQFENTLASVLRTRPSRSQIIVTHLGIYDDPYDLGSEVDFVSSHEFNRSAKNSSRAASPRELAALLNAGIQQATGRVTLTLQPGVELLEGWDSAVETAFEDPQVGSVCAPIFRSDKPNAMAALGVTVGFGQRRKLTGHNKKFSARTVKRLAPIGPALSAGLYRTSMLQQVSPLDEKLDSVYLDLDIALAAESIGYRTRVVEGPIARTDHAIAIKQHAAQPHGKSAQRAAVRHFDRGGLGLLATTALTMACEFVTAPLNPSNLGHALSRIAAITSLRSDRKYADRIAGLTVETDKAQLHQQPQAQSLRRAA